LKSRSNNLLANEDVILVVGVPVDSDDNPGVTDPYGRSADRAWNLKWFQGSVVGPQKAVGDAAYLNRACNLTPIVNPSG